jgi:hypothetical protein
MAKKAKKSPAKKKRLPEQSNENGFSVPVHKSEEDVLREEQKALLDEQHALFKDKYEHPARYWWKHNYRSFIFFVVLVAVITGVVIYFKIKGY